MWFSYWWIFVGIILGQQIGWAIGGQSNHPDAPGKIGAACGFAEGVLAGWLTWRRSPEYQLSIGRAIEASRELLPALGFTLESCKEPVFFSFKDNERYTIFYIPFFKTILSAVWMGFIKE